MKSQRPTRHPVGAERICAALLGLASALAAHAEAPMHTDDAGTLGQGAMKLEAGIGRDGKTRGGELLWGAGVLPNLEMEVSLARATDRSTAPSTTLQGRGLGLKWVPWQSESGWSLGARLDVGRTSVRDRATPERLTHREYALTGLATYRFANEHVLHLNAGHKSTKVDGVRDNAATWAVGYELPLAQRLQFTSEVYGERHTRPDKAIGLRYEIADGLKVSAAVGRGNGRTFSQLGMAWEF